MAEDCRPNEIVLTIPSRMDWLGVVDKVVEGIVEMLDLTEDDGNDLAISVVEAGTNAIQHGHNFDEQKPIKFRFILEEDCLRVRVRDLGPGFDIEKVLKADPTTPESILAPRGRGIFIMRSLMDDVEFDIQPGKGCCAILTQCRKSSNG